MVEQKQFRTKLCVLYQRGRCERQNCSFAHGNAEIRRFSDSFHGREDFVEGDLRDKLDRRHSPRRTYSPVRDARGRNTFRAAESSPSRSLEKESGRRHRKKQRVDGQGDVSGSLRISSEHQPNEGKLVADDTSVLIEQLKQAQLDIDKLDHQKSELQVKLDGRLQETARLTSEVQELEALLRREREENQRILLKINKFVKARNHHSEMQDQLKRSEVRLRMLGDELCLDVEKVGADEEDSIINVVSDGNPVGFPMSPRNEKQKDVLRSNKKQDVNRGPRESAQGKVNVEAPIRSKKVSRWGIPAQPNHDKEIEVEASRNRQPSLTNDKKRETRNTDVYSGKKLKSSGSRLMLPPTSMAAHAVDEDVGIELDATRATANASKRVDNGVTHDIKSFPLPLPPLPPLVNKNYSRYEDNDENIDVDGVEDKGLDVDIM